MRKRIDVQWSRVVWNKLASVRLPDAEVLTASPVTTFSVTQG